MFEYKKFEEKLIETLEKQVIEIYKSYDDVYVVSLDLHEALDSIGIIANTKTMLGEHLAEENGQYYYYKYCEAEWEHFEMIEELSEMLRTEMEENEDKYTDMNNFTYTEAFDEHFDKLTNCCVEALIHLKKTVEKFAPELLLTFNVEEVLDQEERILYFEKINGEESAKEYKEHIDLFG